MPSRSFRPLSSAGAACSPEATSIRPHQVAGGTRTADLADHLEHESQFAGFLEQHPLADLIAALQP